MVFAFFLIMAALLCSLVTGFLFAYAVVVMPGIKAYDDKYFLKTFQLADRIIQDNQPLFIGMWIGSVLALLVAFILGFFALEGFDLLLLFVATVAYLWGVQKVTIKFHLPLNRRIIGLDLNSMSAEEMKQEREGFEEPWNRSNRRRTVISCGVSLLLIVLLYRL